MSSKFAGHTPQHLDYGVLPMKIQSLWDLPLHISSNLKNSVNYDVSLSDLPLLPPTVLACIFSCCIKLSLYLYAVWICHYKTTKKELRYQIIQLTHSCPASIRGPSYSKENFLSTLQMRSMFPKVKIRGKYLLLVIFP